MKFQATIHPFQLTSAHPVPGSFFHSLETRKALLNSVREQIKSESSAPVVSSEQGNRCIAQVQIARENFLGDLQEFCAVQDYDSVEALYMGQQQSRFNHLIEIRNNVGIYLPVFFFFPFQIFPKQSRLPIFVGSAVKLQIELAEIDKALNAKSKIDLGEMGTMFSATEEDVEDYEATHEGVEHFWASFAHSVLGSLVKKSIQTKLPIFVF